MASPEAIFFVSTLHFGVQSQETGERTASNDAVNQRHK